MQNRAKWCLRALLLAALSLLAFTVYEPASALAAPLAPASAINMKSAEIFVRADLLPDGRYKFVGGLTGNLLAGNADAGTRLSVTPISGAPHMLAPWEWRWVDETFGNMSPVVGYPSIHVTTPLVMAPTEPLEVELMAISHNTNGQAMIPYARMQLMACQGNICPQHVQIDLQVYYGASGIQVTLTTQSLVRPGTMLRNGFITHPGGSLLGNNQPQQTFPAYGPGGNPIRQASQIVVPYDVGQYNIDVYSADSALAEKNYFIPGDAFAAASTGIY